MEDGLTWNLVNNICKWYLTSKACNEQTCETNLAKIVKKCIAMKMYNHKYSHIKRRWLLYIKCLSIFMAPKLI